ncbi:hypothetical protein ACIOGT_24715 [Streptomyces microflavus]|uniref:hypothetical protein n=1 Tax=Streptomyces microflavus TaxID=1919 RepID=UPI0037F548EA
MSAEIQYEIDEQRAAERRRAYVNRDLPLLSDYDDGVDLGWDDPPTPPPGRSPITSQRPYTLRWDDADGPHAVDGTSVDMNLWAPRLHRLGVTGDAWDIAVFDSAGADVTWEFFEHLDTGVTR